MNMNYLLKYSSTLLRTAFLFGALTFAGLQTEAQVWKSLITNGNLEGTNVENFFSKESGIYTGADHHSDIFPGVGVNNSRGIVVDGSNNGNNQLTHDDWDTQFFIRANSSLPAGTRIHVVFQYKANRDASCQMQWHEGPGDYLDWRCNLHNTNGNNYDNNLQFTNEWKQLEYTGVIPDYADGCQTIALNLSVTRQSTIFYFDNIVFEYDMSGDGIPVNHNVTHKESYLKQYAVDFQNQGYDLDKQGLASGAQSDWWNYDNATQRVNHFEITHFVKRGESVRYLLPTAENTNDHTMYQRWYNYDNETDLASILDHVTLIGRDNANVPFYLYNNGLVTGERVYWDDQPQSPYAYTHFTFTNTDGENLTVAADVSRYSDMTYQYPNAPLTGDLEEPSLTMRYLYYMNDAKVMAARLTSFPELSDETEKAKDENWLESKVFHFPSKRLPYENDKRKGYQGEFIGLRHIFSDYWVFANGDPNSNDDNNLVSAVINNTSGRIEVVIDDNGTGIRKGGYHPDIDRDTPGNANVNENGYTGYYLDDFMHPWNNPVRLSYADSRFLVFRYPDNGIATNERITNPVTNTVEIKPAYIRVYFNNNGTRYQLAQYTIIFDENSETLPWKSVNGSDKVQGSDRDPNKLREKAGKPIAKISFDYPQNSTYHFPEGYTNHGQNEHTGENYGYDRGQPYLWPDPAHGDFHGIIPESSPVPLVFEKCNYAFDGENALFGAYAMLTNMNTQWGNKKTAVPSNDATYGYNLAPDQRYQSGFLYIDASQLPGDICSIPFEGDFCAGEQLMFSGWISGANEVGGVRSPGGITITLKGEHMVNGQMVTETIYRFCPGMCYELDNGSGDNWGSNGNRVMWQQFYFDFTVPAKYDRHWIEVNNNCVSSQGGDFMLDNIEVYAIAPEIIADINTPICIDKDGHVDMRLLKLMVNFNKEKSTSNVNEGATADLGFVFLKKDIFLTTFKEKLSAMSPAQLHDIGVDVTKLATMFGLDSFSWDAISLDDLAYAIEEGLFDGISGDHPHQSYIDAFNAALLRGEDDNGNPLKTIWYSQNKNQNMGSGVMYFQWNSTFNSMEPYSFAKAVNKTHPTYRYTDDDGDNWIVMNGNYAKLPWEANVDYYIIPSNVPYASIQSFDNVYGAFNLCSPCTKASVFRLDPPYEILGLESSDVTNDVEVCEGTIPTVVTDLIGYDLEGNRVPMQDLNFDWWLGDPQGTPALVATLDNFIEQEKSGNKLNKSLSYFRFYYPEATDLDGVYPHEAKDGKPALTQDMIDYLQEEVDAGRLVLHQSSVSISALKTAENDPYVYLVACPIHDGNFDAALNRVNDPENPENNHEFVSYFCDEAQGLRIKIGNKAPTLMTGFVPNENGFDTYDYSGAGKSVLSIRLAKKEQFETVKHGEPDAPTIDTPASTSAETTHFLWLPIRDAMVQTAGSDRVIQKAEDENIYLASTNDPVWDKTISKSIKKGLLPIVGKIVQLTAIDTNKNSSLKENDENRLCVYFTNNFEVREGYSYTLSLPFQESPSENTCNGNILINLKIVPDYEVWTGGAGNTDWNNDENWRRADGNLKKSTEEPKNGAKQSNNELYRTDDLPDTSPLKDYVTNYTNYRTAKDRLFRKGFAPLYCTHVLIKGNEWGDAPVLYDALDSQSEKTQLAASPFPNLRDKDGWDGTAEAAEPTKATATPILRYDMQARLYDIWSDTYGDVPNKGRSGDLIAEMYQVNSCDEIAFQPTAELLNAHLLNYNNAWVEYQINNKRWYLLGSPLQGTISGEWYAPTGTAQQKTTYYEPVKFNDKRTVTDDSGTNKQALYDRYSPAIYQRSWDKAKAVLYEVGAEYSTEDNPDDLALVNGAMPGDPLQGQWASNWNTQGADDYLDRLGYRPLGDKKANVAIKGVWSNTYNDATVDYTKGGFSVMVMNHLKDNDQSEGKSIIRLPKEDTMYDYYKFKETGAANGGTDTYLSDTQENDYDDVQTNLHRALNRGRLKTDQLLPLIGDGLQTYQKIQRTETTASRYGDKRTYTRVPTRVGSNALPMTLKPFTENVSAGISNLGYYLVENPFITGLDMKKFFAENTGLEKKYWILTPNGQQLVQYVADGSWVSPADNDDFAPEEAKLAPGQGFFVQATTAGEATEITFTADMQAQTRYGEPDAGDSIEVVVGTKQKMELIPALDEEGNPLLDEQNQPIMVEVPEVDSQGNYVLEEIIDTVIVYKFKQKKGAGNVFPLKSRTRGGASKMLPGLVISAQREGLRSSALVMKRSYASDDFMPEEDTELFTTDDLKNVPTVYTLCGRLATTINSIRDFRSLPLGVESASDAPCVLTFQGVETLGDSVAFYDAVEQKLTPLESGMQFSVSGQTQNRYYLVRTLNLLEAKEETHLQIFAEGLMAKVIASTEEPITSVSCYDASGRLVYTAKPDAREHSFKLPDNGVYIIEAQTDNDRKTKKVMVK